MIDRRSREKVINLEIYTDGSLKKLSSKMTFGGWGFIVVRDSKKIYEAAGSEYGTTNQRMELEAMRQALNYASQIRRPSEKVALFSDSAYLINCYMKEWYITWMRNGWVNANDKPVANQDLWRDIIPYFDNFWYEFQKVKGHADNYWNILCDELAQDAADKLKRSWRGTNGN